ncbi:hypothetical protein BHE74_00028561 [Ensete ventricosum]|nr:hypothetical protein BHE74_00028561 [Ensete ventricosum]
MWLCSALLIFFPRFQPYTLSLPSHLCDRRCPLTTPVTPRRILLRIGRYCLPHRPCHYHRLHPATTASPLPPLLCSALTRLTPAPFFFPTTRLKAATHPPPCHYFRPPLFLPFSSAPIYRPSLPTVPPLPCCSSPSPLQ